MKAYRILLVIMLSLFTANFYAIANQRISVTLTDGPSPSVKLRMQRSLSYMLNEINAAYNNNRLPDFAEDKVSNKAKKRIQSIWKNTAPFYCSADTIIKPVWNRGRTPEVHYIPCVYSDLDGEDANFTVKVSFDRNGKITDLRIGLKQYEQFVLNNALEDFETRELILGLLEEFRTAYEEKNIDYIEKIFSEDALIVTGRVIQVAPSKEVMNISNPKIEYSIKDKQKYIKDLSRCFNNAVRIVCKFGDAEVSRHPTRQGIYGVRVFQHWENHRKNSKYMDDGSLFLIWDFTGDEPVIKVRTWQPIETPDKDLFILEDWYH